MLEPGSPAALVAGCTCPLPDPDVLLIGFDADGVACKVIECSERCPLHGPLFEERRRAG